MKQLYLILIILFASCNSNTKEQHLYDKIESVIFMHSYFGITEIYPTNASVLITNKDSIKELENLFNNNELAQECLCGYNYRIQFLDKDGKLLFSEYYYPDNIYSRDDKKIKEIVESLGSRMSVKPTHFIYNVKVNIEAKEAMKELRSLGIFAFQMDAEMDERNHIIQILHIKNLDVLKQELKKHSFIEKIEEAISEIPTEVD